MEAQMQLALEAEHEQKEKDSLERAALLESRKKTATAVLEVGEKPTKGEGKQPRDVVKKKRRFGI